MAGGGLSGGPGVTLSSANSCPAARLGCAAGQNRSSALARRRFDGWPTAETLASHQIDVAPGGAKVKPLSALIWASRKTGNQNLTPRLAFSSDYHQHFCDPTAKPCSANNTPSSVVSFNLIHFQGVLRGVVVNAACLSRRSSRVFGFQRNKMFLPRPLIYIRY